MTTVLMPTSGLLLLADSRLPTGGHAHSAGVEAAVERGLLRDEAGLAQWLAGRLLGSAAAIAAAAAAGCLLAAAEIAPEVSSEVPPEEPVDWARWDGAVSARTPSAATREASRAQGAALLRTARQIWSSPALEALSAHHRPHHPLVLGAAVAAAGDTPDAAALLALHHLVGGACSAAVRLLGLDPIAVAATAARAGQAAERIAREATLLARAAVARRDTRLLPSTGTPLPEVLAELHARAEVTLFAS
ncbi:MAG TPA: urease accessory UreF family protein [Pseudonocardiaceae bacterium]